MRNIEEKNNKWEEHYNQFMNYPHPHPHHPHHHNNNNNYYYHNYHHMMISSALPSPSLPSDEKNIQKSKGDELLEQIMITTVPEHNRATTPDNGSSKVIGSASGIHDSGSNKEGEMNQKHVYEKFKHFYQKLRYANHYLPLAEKQNFKRYAKLLNQKREMEIALQKLLDPVDVCTVQKWYKRMRNKTRRKRNKCLLAVHRIRQRERYNALSEQIKTWQSDVTKKMMSSSQWGTTRKDDDSDEKMRKAKDEQKLKLKLQLLEALKTLRVIRLAKKESRSIPPIFPNIFPNESNNHNGANGSCCGGGSSGGSSNSTGIDDNIHSIDTSHDGNDAKSVFERKEKEWEDRTKVISNFYYASQRDMLSFIKIRSMWDQYLTFQKGDPHDTYQQLIPLEYPIQPPLFPQTSSPWKKYAVTENVLW